MEKNIIIFAPHPGDETWGCGGTIAKKSREGYCVSIVVMTDGRYSFLKMLGIDSDPTPEELKEIRAEEVKRSTKILGVKDERIFLLGVEDGKLRENSEMVQEKVVEILNRFSPSEIYYTYEKDAHEDHQAANLILRNSIQNLNLQTANYQYSILHKNSRFGPFIDRLLNLIKHNNIQVDISDVLPLKEKAINELKSEVAIISHKQEKPLHENFTKSLKKKENFFIQL